MKKLLQNIFTKIALLLVFIAGVAVSCNPEPPDPTNPPNEYPIDIPFTEYSLEETACQWINLPYDDKVIVINSSEELEKYISCSSESYPVIDFSKNSLLLASGKTDKGISEIEINNLQQLSFNKYKLNIDIVLNDVILAEPWSKALIVEKLNNESSVDLKIPGTVNILSPCGSKSYDSKSDFDGTIEILYMDGELNIKRCDVSVICDYDFIDVTKTFDGETITIYEKEESGGNINCVCKVDFEYFVGKFERGTYHLIIYLRSEIIYNQTITL
ncbi:MAG: hypothetical protein FWH59_01740 [Lentimicrobiaceae bacterium]|nr:hypothetical protein [Lentimicrobiaceae bacterium]